jgi:deoxyhypusine synthase
MYDELKFRLINSLKYELDYVSKFEENKMKKYQKILQIKNVMIVLENYEEMELDIAKMINQHAQKKKWEKEER